MSEHPGFAALQERSRRRDPFTALWFLAALGVYALHGFQSAITRDSAFYVYAGQEVADGAAPYVELMNRAGPFAHLIPGLGVFLARLVDVPDVYGVRVVFFVIAALATPLVYRLASAAFVSRNAGHLAAAAMLSFTGFAAFATSGPQSKTPVATLIVWILLLAIRHRWLAAGIVTGIATLTWQPIFFAAAPACLVACLFVTGGARPRLAAIVRYAVGGLLTVAATVGYFLVMRALPEFLDGFVLANAQYTRQDGIQDSFGAAWVLFQEGFGWSSWVFAIGFVLLLVAGLVALSPRRDERARWVRQSTLVLLAALVGGSFWTYGVYNGWADAFLLLPLAALGFGAAVGAVSRGWARVPVAVLVAACVVTSIGATSWEMWRTRTHLLVAQQEATDAVFSRLPDDATAISAQAPHPLALSGVRSMSRYQLFTDGMDKYIDDHWDGGLAGYAEWIADEKPTVLSVNVDGIPAWMRPAVIPEYRYVGSAPEFYFYLHRSVDAETRAEIGAALDEIRAEAGFESGVTGS